MELIKKERINKKYGIVLQRFDSGGYEVAISSTDYADRWVETDGIYSRKRDALKVYGRMKKEYAKKGE